MTRSVAGADLRNAVLADANLGCYNHGIDCTDLIGAHLDGADLSGAHLTDTIMPDGSRHS